MYTGLVRYLVCLVGVRGSAPSILRREDERHRARPSCTQRIHTREKTAQPWRLAALRPTSSCLIDARILNMNGKKHVVPNPALRTLPQPHHETCEESAKRTSEYVPTAHFRWNK